MNGTEQVQTNSKQSQPTNLMKTFLITTAALSLVTSALAQGGTVIFATRLTFGLPPYFSQVFTPEIGDPYHQKTGNTVVQLPAGTQSYTGSPLTGSGWTAQLFSLPGSTIPNVELTLYGVPVSDSLLAAAPTTTFRTGTASGSVALTTATLVNVAGDSEWGVIQMRVFPTSYGSWENAVLAYDNHDPSAAIGASPMFLVQHIGGAVFTPPQLTGVSFSLVVVPEPTSVALVGLGTVVIAIWRCRPCRISG